MTCELLSASMFSPAQLERILRMRHGVIVVTDGRVQGIYARRWPKIVSCWESWLVGGVVHRLRPGDRCRLYFRQPRRFPWCIALQYVVSSRGTSFASFRRAVATLDEVAQAKGVDTLVTDVCNQRISDRLLRRWGWQPHAPMRFHRNYVKRLYELEANREGGELLVSADAKVLASVAAGELPL